MEITSTDSALENRNMDKQNRDGTNNLLISILKTEGRNSQKKLVKLYTKPSYGQYTLFDYNEMEIKPCQALYPAAQNT